MADPDLKSIPKKTLKKVIQECNLSALLSSDEGQAFFKSYLSHHPEHSKYWDFYNSVSEIILNSDNQEQQLDSIKECFEKHISIGADSEDRVDACIQNRADVENLSKAINEKDCENLQKILSEKQQSAFEYLNREAFLPLLPEFKGCTSKKTSYCDLS
jgi:hypothetical protein